MRSVTIRPAAGQAWLPELLFGGTPTVRWAAAGGLPAGFDRADRFAVIPAGDGRSFWLSLASRRGASSALTSYNSLRSGRTRLVRRALAFGLRIGLAQPLLRNKIDVGIAPNLAPAQTEDLLGVHLRRLFGHDRIVMAISGGSGPYRKPVLQIFAADGVPLGYVKVGWNDWTHEAVRREAAALQACAKQPMRLGVPEFLGLSSWQGLELLVTSPLPRGVRSWGLGNELPDASVLAEISELAPGFAGELAASPWWHSVRSRIQDAVADAVARSALELAADRIERAHGREPLRFGAWHGDLVPWNLARLGSRPYAWDWESSTTEVPLGFDAVHFHYSVAFIARRHPLAEAAVIAAGDAGAALRALGVPERARRLVALLHLVELAVRHEQARSSTGEVDGRFYPDVLSVIEQSLPGAQQVTGPRSGGRAA